MGLINSIPKRFKLFGTTITIVFDNKSCDQHGAFGHFTYGQSLITLSDIDKHEPLSEDRIKDCYYHEKVHAILMAMREHELNDNEKFVDIFAKLLRQSDETAEYELG